MSHRIASFIVAMGFGLLLATASVRGGIATMSVDHADGTATFTIEFSHPPDFYTVNSANLPADTFSVQIAANPNGPNPLAYSNLTSIVRGDEIRFVNALPIRNATPPVTNAEAGGWGTVRGTVPFTVAGDTLTFTAPLKVLGATSGVFAYRASTDHFGKPVAQSQGVSVPLPSALMSGLLLGGILMLVGFGKSVIPVRA